MRRFVLALAVAGLLAACGQANQAPSSGITSEEAAPPPAMDAYAPAERGGADGRQQAQAQGGASGTPAAAPQPTGPAQAGQPTGPAPVLFLAYAYAKQLEIPSERLAGVMDRHVQACQAAGPRLCQLIGANRSGEPQSYMEGFVSMRGEPTWLRGFMGGISAQVDDAGGRVVGESTTTEDLTRQIVDTEAHLRAQTALRDRLQDLLRTSRGRLSDLLEVERELARVQGEIDAVQSNLAVMRTRVAMSELTLNYRSAPRPVGSDTLEPLRRAFANFLGIIVGGFAVIVTLIAGLVPLAVVVVPIVWAILVWRRRRGGRLFGAAPEAGPADPGGSS